MKKVLLAIFISLTCLYGNAVEFTCPEIDSNIQRWNAICEQYKSNLNTWAQMVVDSGAYKLNSNGGAEYEYIITCSDSIDIVKLKETTIDFIQQNFNINNATRSDIVQGSTENSIYFKGKILRISEIKLLVDYIFYHADIIFNVKFKSNRLKLSIEIPYIHGILSGRRRETRVFAFYQFQHYDSYNKDLINRDAKALINIYSNILNYSSAYLKYINANYTPTNTQDEEDW